MYKCYAPPFPIDEPLFPYVQLNAIVSSIARIALFSVTSRFFSRDNLLCFRQLEE